MGRLLRPNYAYADFATTGPVPNDPRNTDPNGIIYVQPDPNRNVAAQFIWSIPRTAPMP